MPGTGTKDDPFEIKSLDEFAPVLQAICRQRDAEMPASLTV